MRIARAEKQEEKEEQALHDDGKGRDVKYREVRSENGSGFGMKCHAKARRRKEWSAARERSCSLHRRETERPTLRLGDFA